MIPIYKLIIISKKYLNLYNPKKLISLLSKMHNPNIYNKSKANLSPLPQKNHKLNMVSYKSKPIIKKLKMML